VKIIGTSTAKPNTRSGGARNNQGVIAREGFIERAW